MNHHRDFSTATSAASLATLGTPAYTGVASAFVVSITIRYYTSVDLFGSLQEITGMEEYDRATNAEGQSMSADGQAESQTLTRPRPSSPRFELK